MGSPEEERDDRGRGEPSSHPQRRSRRPRCPARRRRPPAGPGFHPPPDPHFRPARRGGSGAGGSEGGPAARRGGHRVPRRRGVAAPVRECRCVGGRPAGALRPRPRSCTLLDGTARVHTARTERVSFGSDRWQPCGSRTHLRLAVRARPGERPPLRHHRRLPELCETGVQHALAASLRWHRLRAHRRAGQQAPPRHGVRPPALQRQGLHGVGDGAG